MSLRFIETLHKNFILFVILLLCLADSVWNCDQLVGEEGPVALLFFGLYMCALCHRCLFVLHTRYGNPAFIPGTEFLILPRLSYPG